MQLLCGSVYLLAALWWASLSPLLWPTLSWSWRWSPFCNTEENEKPEASSPSALREWPLGKSAENDVFPTAFINHVIECVLQNGYLGSSTERRSFCMKKKIFCWISTNLFMITLLFLLTFPEFHKFAGSSWPVTAVIILPYPNGMIQNMALFPSGPF